MQVFLKKHGPGASIHSLKFILTREGRRVRITYQVQKRDSGAWHSDPNFSNDYMKNWGLWNKDVVEAFLQLRSSPHDLKAPYLEIQVSPENQPFALVIQEPRKAYHAPENLEFKTEAHVDGRLWTGTMEVVLPPELQGTVLYGGFFACLTTEPREFFALEPNPEAHPDFHRPELFLPLDHE